MTGATGNGRSAPKWIGDGLVTTRKHLPIAATGTGMTGTGKNSGSPAMNSPHGKNAMAELTG